VKPIDPTILWDTWLAFLASPLIFLIRPVRKKPALRHAALVFVLACYLLAFFGVVVFFQALSGLP
jgi:hypothetical protein